jgi:aminopeptidase-like protein
MSLSDAQTAMDLNGIGQEMYQRIAALYPFCRSITGDGVRQTLQALQRDIPLTIHEVPTGVRVFDWTVPKEWNIRDAYIKNAKGERIVDFKNSNLHVVSYSTPTKKKVSLEELKEHVFTLPEHPEWIPYRTTYYKENWGFCLSHKQFLELRDEEYEVCIDASLEDGHLTYGECYLPGQSRDEVLLSCHICHPSLCNDNLSGIALMTLLAKFLQPLSRRYSYRFLFIPGTIGSIVWLCLNEAKVANIKHGFVVAGVGDAGDFTYKRSRRGDAEIDRIAAHVLKHAGTAYNIIDFIPYGYDERQFCSPGFNLPVGCVMRTPHNEYPEYHTSADNLDFVRPQYLVDSFVKCASMLRLVEGNQAYVNQNPKCEPQLGKRGLYRPIGGQALGKADELALLWTLNLSDGHHTVLDIAEKAGCRFEAIRHAADALVKSGLLK